MTVRDRRNDQLHDDIGMADAKTSVTKSDPSVTLEQLDTRVVGVVGTVDHQTLDGRQIGTLDPDAPPESQPRAGRCLPRIIVRSSFLVRGFGTVTSSYESRASFPQRGSPH